MSKSERLGLLSVWKITPEELNEILVENPSMRGLVFGYIAEFKLRKLIEADKRFVYEGKPKDHDKTQKSELIINIVNSLLELVLNNYFDAEKIKLLCT